MASKIVKPKLGYAGMLDPFRLDACWDAIDKLACRLDAAEFRESEHPRDNDGKFTSAGGGGGWSGNNISPGDKVVTHGGAIFEVKKIVGNTIYSKYGKTYDLSNVLKAKKPGGEWQHTPEQPKQSEKPEAPSTKQPEPAEQPKQSQAEKPTEKKEVFAKTFEERQSQAKQDSKLSDFEFRAKYGVSISGDGTKKKKVKEAIALLPDHIRQQISAAGIRVITLSRPISSGSHSHVAEFRSGSKTITVPDGYYVRGSLQNLKDPVGVTVHELGHAFDHATGRQFQRDLAKQVDEDAKQLNKLDREYAAHFFSNDGEKFAELFRLAYSSNGGFEKRQSSAERVFAKSLAMIRQKFGE